LILRLWTTLVTTAESGGPREQLLEGALHPT
jgi:hypothetical protein